MPSAVRCQAILCSNLILFLATTVSNAFAFSVNEGINSRHLVPHCLRLPSPRRNYITFNGATPLTHPDDCQTWSSIGSRTSIETVIHTGDCGDYDVNCVQYRKARFWRELSTPDIEEEIRKVRKVLAKIELYRKTKNPALHPSSLGNTRRTLAQLLFIRHERHLASLREKEESKKRLLLAEGDDATIDGHG